MDWDFKESDYQYSKPLLIRKWNGGKIYVMVGYVREHPEKNQICLVKEYAAKGGRKEQKYNIAGEKDWNAIRSAIESLWPQLKENVSKDEITAAVTKVSQDVQLLGLLAQYPSLLENLPSNVDLLTLPDDQKEALRLFLSAGGEVAGKAIKKLSNEPINDVADFVTVLEALRLASVNSLVNHVNARLSFIKQFEKAIHDDSSYERRGPDSIHNLLKANIWILDRNYSILHDDQTLKNIIISSFNRSGGQIQNPSHRPDFLCMSNRRNEEDSPKQLVIIEIKRPSVVLKMENIEQLMDYKRILNRHTGQQITDFKCYLVGREIDDRLRENNLSASGFIVKTYTDFIAEARDFYSEYAEVVESDQYAI